MPLPISISPLIKHLLTTNREQILKRSLMHCHAFNVHSIMLLESPGRTIRLFVAEPGHHLEQNFIPEVFANQSIAFHSHHCELTFLQTRGQMTNWVVRKDVEGAYGPYEFKYQSAISNGKIGFKRIRKQFLSSGSQDVLEPGLTCHMPANAIHTVAALSYQWAAWLVFEGREDPNYDSSCYSFSNLDEQDFSHLYKPMSEDNLERLIEESYLI